jgi:hypothetical protein
MICLQIDALRMSDLNSVVNIIQQAENLIYMEQQYCTYFTENITHDGDPPAASVCCAALKNLSHGNHPRMNKATGDQAKQAPTTEKAESHMVVARLSHIHYIQLAKDNMFRHVVGILPSVEIKNKKKAITISILFFVFLIPATQ